MLNDPVIRKSIYASLISSVVVIVFIQPLLRITGKLIIWIGTNIYEGFSNSIYREAAMGLREKYSFILLILFIALLVGTLTGISLARHFIESKHKKAISHKSKIFLIIILIVLFLNSLYLLSFNYAAFQMNTSFNQRLTVLAPNITDIELKQFRAKWASIKNRKDYEALNGEMDNLAESKNIKLPKILWK